MTTQAVVDASVACKWVRLDGDEAAQQALEVIRETARGTLQLVAPALLPIEVMNAIRYSGLEAEDAAVLASEFDAFHVMLYECDSARLDRALAMAYQHGLSIYDAVYLQLAEELGCPLVTADRRAFAKVASGVEIRLP